VLDDSGGALELRLDRAATIASDALRPTSPELADLAKTRLAGFAVQIAGRRDAVDAVRAANALKLLALIVPAVALVLFLVGVALARRKAIGWAWVGVGICAAGVVATAAAVLGRERITSSIASISRPAVGGVWDSIVGDLRWWGLVAFVVGAILAAVAALSARGQNRRRAARVIRVNW
jgi:phosphoglycerol transferase MdoB-like AlkP superfamily enzyme